MDVDDARGRASPRWSAAWLTEPVTEEELARAKALLTTAWWRQLSTVGGRADTLGRYATQFGDPATAAYRLPQWLAVTADDITEAAAARLQARVPGHPDLPPGGGAA